MPSSSPLTPSPQPSPSANRAATPDIQRCTQVLAQPALGSPQSMPEQDAWEERNAAAQTVVKHYDFFYSSTIRQALEQVVDQPGVMPDAVKREAFVLSQAYAPDLEPQLRAPLKFSARFPNSVEYAAALARNGATGA